MQRGNKNNHKNRSAKDNKNNNTINNTNPTTAPATREIVRANQRDNNNPKQNQSPQEDDHVTRTDFGAVAVGGNDEQQNGGEAQSAHNNDNNDTLPNHQQMTPTPTTRANPQRPSTTAMGMDNINDTNEGNRPDESDQEQEEHGDGESGDENQNPPTTQSPRQPREEMRREDGSAESGDDGPSDEESQDEEDEGTPRVPASDASDASANSDLEDGSIARELPRPHVALAGSDRQGSPRSPQSSAWALAWSTQGILWVVIAAAGIACMSLLFLGHVRGLPKLSDVLPHKTHTNDDPRCCRCPAPRKFHNVTCDDILNSKQSQLRWVDEVEFTLLGQKACVEKSNKMLPPGYERVTYTPLKPCCACPIIPVDKTLLQKYPIPKNLTCEYVPGSRAFSSQEEEEIFLYHLSIACPRRDGMFLKAKTNKMIKF